MNNNKLAWVGILIAIVIALGSFIFHPAPASVTAGGTTNYDTLGISGLKLGTGCNDGFKTCTATTFTKLNGGSCIVWAGSQTIAASSTALVECQSSSTGSLAALAGALAAGDRVFVTAPTSTSAIANGLVINGATASSTAPGFIDIRVSNLTGQTFTWTAAASTTWAWFGF